MGILKTESIDRKHYEEDDFNRDKSVLMAAESVEASSQKKESLKKLGMSSRQKEAYKRHITKSLLFTGVGRRFDLLYEAAAKRGTYVEFLPTGMEEHQRNMSKYDCGSSIINWTVSIDGTLISISEQTTIRDCISLAQKEKEKRRLICELDSEDFPTYKEEEEEDVTVQPSKALKRKEEEEIVPGSANTVAYLLVNPIFFSPISSLPLPEFSRDERRCIKKGIYGQSGVFVPLALSDTLISILDGVPILEFPHIITMNKDEKPDELVYSTESTTFSAIWTKERIKELNVVDMVSEMLEREERRGMEWGEKVE
ncbi:hypothetical protein ADUPG1_007685 [Aduncisulcus paluster]|uniref:BCD1 alpha/beta domain-containing protein n=1 Tax=Aduncisulcus paluster TaxID=2918883 RepID=A0ABQ5KTI1_9EUKA|nr:hypothetical protein ADUPG1_007685 [Aduncisulcus paluster]